MLDILIISKILVSIFFVVGLSFVTEHVSPRVAGIFAGYPLGAAISLFFIGIENGKEFAAQGAIYTLGGLSASLIFVYVYYKVSSEISRGKVFFPALFSTVAFLVAAKLLSLSNLTLLSGFILTFSCLLFFSFILEKYPMLWW